MTPIKKEFQYGVHKVTLETGEIARQADGAIMIDMDGTVVQCTVVGSGSRSWNGLKQILMKNSRIYDLRFGIYEGH